ncbi:hypothetical protein Fot_47947 [Forsythia ovata]|uniref:Uncharacterized protein n=1 Tax=Forsythia ovata TaxID=205694 RepID=A0ABD1QRZ5_9LAMI
MAVEAGSFSKTIGSNSSRQNSMLMHSTGGGIGVQNAPSQLSISTFLLSDCLELLGDDTGPTRNEVEGASDVTAGAGEIKKELPTTTSDVCKTVTPGTGAAKGTRDGGRISCTTPPRLILSFGTLGK